MLTNIAMHVTHNQHKMLEQSKPYVGPYYSFCEVSTPLFPTPTSNILNITEL
jgi:hypothetical protein